ncbi:MAG TPA: hypothetical protein VD694_05680 [Nitrososphaeraceae archaeon]|nr:hypothetical protein [Nitrososphaeraceae archaeon]
MSELLNSVIIAIVGTLVVLIGLKLKEEKKEIGYYKSLLKWARI